MRQLCGIFDFETGQYTDKSKDVNIYTNDQCGIYFYGRIKFDGIDADAKRIWELFKSYGAKITEWLQGIYILIIYDKTKNELYVFQDRTTSALTLYYTSSHNKIYLSTSLKWILKESKGERRFNESVFKEFFINGYIYGKETLIEGVYKIQAYHGLSIKKGEIEEFAVKYSIEQMTKGEALGKWEEVLTAAINQSSAEQKEISIPLSSGYDSNYIAYILSKEGSRPINAFSIGGKFGKNELPVVNKNITEYKNIELNTALTDEDTLSKLPDIVWRLEGSVYEVGIFLQYELFNLVSKSNKKSLICGECADQVMNRYYLDDERIFTSQNEASPMYYEFSEYPYIFGSYLILKKSGILSNSFGIDTEYPYLDDNFVSIANALKSVNEKDKRIHVAVCRERLPEIVVKNMSKTGGATDFHSLFADKAKVNKFISSFEKSEFYKKHEAVIKAASSFEKEKQTGIKKIKSRIRNIVLDICRLNVTQRRQTVYYFEELKLKEYMCCLYLMLFDKLFISGEYDEKLDNETINISLDELMSF